ncbi:MAG: type II secretion system protein [Dissulfurispiraceae bacterium]|jgi:prepilin-type N-terminal cleavage/methylation domain-containing protein
MKSFFSVSSKGFTLVEMAIVLVIIGIVMALGLPLLSQLAANVKYNDSLDIVKAGIDSVQGWAAGGSLQQLPDLRNTTSDFRTIAKSPTDAFGQPLIYVYDYNSSTFTSNQLCGMRMTSITLNYTVGTTKYTVANVAFLVLSPGGDYKINSTITASNFIGANNAALVTYTNAAIPSPGGTTNSGATITINADTSNDIVQWVTLDALRTKIGCQGAQLTIVNNELPYGYNSTQYSASIYANGGVPITTSPGGKGQYNWCLQGQAIYNMTFANAPAQGGANIYTSSSCMGSQNSWSQSDYVAITGQPVIIVTDGSNNYISSAQNNIGFCPPGSNPTYWQAVNISVTNAPNCSSAYYYPSGSNFFSIYVSDNSMNTSFKNFTFTVNP